MQARAAGSKFAIETTLAGISSVTDIDFSQFDLDEQLSEGLATNGKRGSLDKFAQAGSGKTLRELVADRLNSAGCIELVGTPGQLARILSEALAQQRVATICCPVTSASADKPRPQHIDEEHPKSGYQDKEREDARACLELPEGVPAGRIAAPGPPQNRLCGDQPNRFLGGQTSAGSGN
jgi:hypothetical protein